MYSTITPINPFFDDIKTFITSIFIQKISKREYSILFLYLLIPRSQETSRSGENDNAELFKDPEMLKRFEDITEFKEEDRKYILYTLDALIKNIKLKSIA